MSDKINPWDAPFDLNRDGKLDFGEQLIKYKVISDLVDIECKKQKGCCFGKEIRLCVLILITRLLLFIR